MIGGEGEFNNFHSVGYISTKILPYLDLSLSTSSLLIAGVGVGVEVSVEVGVEVGVDVEVGVKVLVGLEVGTGSSMPFPNSTDLRNQYAKVPNPNPPNPIKKALLVIPLEIIFLLSLKF